MANETQLSFESGSLETLKRIVERQYGYTLLPELATLDLSQKQQQFVKQFNEPHPIREVSLITHRSFMKKKLIELLKDEILKQVPRKPARSRTRSINQLGIIGAYTISPP